MILQLAGDDARLHPVFMKVSHSLEDLKQSHEFRQPDADAGIAFFSGSPDSKAAHTIFPLWGGQMSRTN